MNPWSRDCSCSCVSFSISYLQPGHRLFLSYDRRSFHSQDNQLKTLYLVWKPKNICYELVIGSQADVTMIRIRYSVAKLTSSGV